MGVPAVKGGKNVPPPPVGIGLTDLPKIGSASVAPLAPPVSTSLNFGTTFSVSLEVFEKRNFT